LPWETEVSTERGGDENGSSVLAQWGEGEDNLAIPKCSVEVRVANLQSNWKMVGRRMRSMEWIPATVLFTVLGKLENS
jgi:hypothetical protein